MAADLGAAQSDLSASLIDLRGSPNADPTLVSQSEQQLAVIMALKGQLSTATGKQLVAISVQVAAAVSTAAGTARQAQQAAASGISSGSGSLGQASQAARAAVNEFEDAYFKDHKFDAYLHFKSEEDEREFHQREAERQAQIEKALALHTPQGDLLAAQLSEAQLRDAGAHGADRSPDFAPLLAKVEASRETLKTTLGENGKKEAASERLNAAQAPSAGNEAADIPADVLASFRKMKAPETDAAGHGLGAKLVSEQPDRSGPPL